MQGEPGMKLASRYDVHDDAGQLWAVRAVTFSCGCRRHQHWAGSRCPEHQATWVHSQACGFRQSILVRDP